MFVSKPYEGNLGVSLCPVGVQIHMVENLISGALGFLCVSPSRCQERRGDGCLLCGCLGG